MFLAISKAIAVQQIGLLPLGQPFQAIVQFPARFLILHNALRLHGVGVGYGFDALQLFLSRQNIIQRNALVTDTILVLCHHPLLKSWIVDIGPKAGRKGGEVVFQGTYEQMLKTHTLTAQYLNGEQQIVLPEVHRKGNGKSIWLYGCKGNNLKDVDIEFPLGKLIVVTGVSGSGKSTLINETLQPILSQHFYRSLKIPMEYSKIEGIDNVDKVVNVDQSPIGRTPRSNPATYTGVFSDIRNLFVNLPEAKIRGYKPGRFSFNVKGGRCEGCGGNGYRTIEMNLLPDVMVP